MNDKYAQPEANGLVPSSNPIEKDAILHFVLKLYHDSHIQIDGLISKATVRNEFLKYVKANGYQKQFSNINIGTLLRTSNFLSNTPRGSPSYGIAMRKLFEFRNAKLKQMDDSRLYNHTSRDPIKPYGSEDNDQPLEENIEIRENAEEFPVLYEGGGDQKILPNFTLTSLGCYICQKNFKKQSDFEEHVTTHGIETDFEFLSTRDKENIFKVIYRLCDNSHYFNFTITTEEKGIIIDKIIIIQTRRMHFVNNNKVPYEIPSGKPDSFFVDSHLFTQGVEQPIVVVYRDKLDKKNLRFIEQHHFLRGHEFEFPEVHFPTRAWRLPNSKPMVIKYRLAEYYPSANIINAQKSGFPDSFLCDISESHRKYVNEGQVLNSENIGVVLKTLVNIEDLEVIREYDDFREKGVRLRQFGNEYSVKFEKLPKNVSLEGYVSIMDRIILTTYHPKKLFSATVESVYHNRICFQYKKKHRLCTEKLYDIVVQPSRLQIRYQYRALSLLNKHTIQYIMPECNNAPKNISTLELELFNPTVEKNPEQLQAVRNIADGPSSLAPYVIFGPPGTGKTTTIVEAVLQLWQRRADTQILITAGSNSACDEVALRLCRVLVDLQPHKMNVLRLFSKSNEKRIDSIDDILIQASNFYGGHFYPKIELIRQYRIIVCTLTIVGKLATANIGESFFTHIFVDECAASTIPEVLVGCAGASLSKTRLIISGDTKQLGPIIKSKRAGGLGLNVSFMEHLMKRDCYAVNENGEYDRSIQTRLTRNYRSHPEIVGLYNQMYYNNELKAMANQDNIEWGLQWHLLPSKNHPIIFHSVYGSSLKNDKSPSLSNEKEVNVVMEYVKDLLYFGIKCRTIEETDIGIISPYKKQCARIQEELNLRRWHQIEVGAVETFQGKEKAIIIVSTVRSFTRTLGFLDNPRRLNVILSRPQVLLIIIGNPITLGQNKDFRYIIDECRRNKSTVGAFRGYDPQSPDDKIENVMEKLSLNDEYNFLPALAEESRKTLRNSNNQNINLRSTGQLKSNPDNKYKRRSMPKNSAVCDKNKKLSGKKEIDTMNWRSKVAVNSGAIGLSNNTLSTFTKRPILFCTETETKPKMRSTKLLCSVATHNESDDEQNDLAIKSFRRYLMPLRKVKGKNDSDYVSDGNSPIKSWQSPSLDGLKTDNRSGEIGCAKQKEVTKTTPKQNPFKRIEVAKYNFIQKVQHFMFPTAIEMPSVIADSPIKSCKEV